MAGGLLNLVAYGNANLILTGNPTKSFFKFLYFYPLTNEKIQGL